MPEILGRLRTPRLAAAPSAPTVGEVYYDTAANKLYWWNGTAWIDATGGAAAKTFRTGHTWMVAGAVSAATLPPIFVPEGSGQAATLIAVRAQILSGTNVTVQMQYNGSNLGSAIIVTTTAGSTAFSQAVTDLDRLVLVLSIPVGSPADLSVTAIVEHVV
jgi:hypothetical protein